MTAWSAARRRASAWRGAEGVELSLVEHEYSAVGQDATLARSQVELGRMLGKGEFGKVYRANVFPTGGGAVVVAAVKEPCAGALADFAEEVDIICKVRSGVQHCDHLQLPLPAPPAHCVLCRVHAIARSSLSSASRLVILLFFFVALLLSFMNLFAFSASTTCLASLTLSIRLVLHPCSQVYRLGGHANIAGMIGFVPRGQNGDVPLLALELCELGDVKSFLREQGALYVKATCVWRTCCRAASRHPPFHFHLRRNAWRPVARPCSTARPGL